MDKLRPSFPKFCGFANHVFPAFFSALCGVRSPRMIARDFLIRSFDSAMRRLDLSTAFCSFFSIVVYLRFHNGRKLIPSSRGECLILNNRGAFVRLLRRGAGRLSEQPAGTLAQGAKPAAGLNDQERVAWNRPTGGVAAFATTNRKPHQNFPFPKAHRTGTVCGLPAQNPQVFGEYADIIGRRRKNESLQRFDDFLKGRRVFSKRRKRNMDT